MLHTHWNTHADTRGKKECIFITPESKTKKKRETRSNRLNEEWREQADATLNEVQSNIFHMEKELDLSQDKGKKRKASPVELVGSATKKSPKEIRNELEEQGVKNLKEACQKAKLPTSGAKKDLIERLVSDRTQAKFGFQLQAQFEDLH